MFVAKNIFLSTFIIKVQPFCFLSKQFFENVKKVYSRGFLERVGRVTVNTTFFFRLSQNRQSIVMSFQSISSRPHFK